MVHADVTLRNVMVDETAGDMLTLVDFGSCFLRGAPCRDPARTTSAHVLAPELLSGRQPDPAADVWATGVFAWALLFGGPGPFVARGGDAGVLEMLQRFADGEFEIGEMFDRAVESVGGLGEGVEEVKEFVGTCLSRDVLGRFCRVSSSAELEKAKWAEVVDYARIKSHPFLRFVPEQ